MSNTLTTSQIVEAIGFATNTPAVRERVVDCLWGCDGIIDPANTVPELVELLGKLLMADLIPDPLDGYVYTLIDAESEEGRAVIKRARAVLAKTGTVKP